tara:strand:- start:86 stop:442 length:357 start_codon:yes stop_codon:yes gene_type:complete
MPLLKHAAIKGKIPDRPVETEVLFDVAFQIFHDKAKILKKKSFIQGWKEALVESPATITFLGNTVNFKMKYWAQYLSKTKWESARVHPQISDYAAVQTNLPKPLEAAFKSALRKSGLL